MNRLFSVLAVTTFLIGCDAPDPETAPSTTVEPNAELDADPTPQTGTGGETPNSPDGSPAQPTPGGRAMERQPSPSD